MIFDLFKETPKGYWIGYGNVAPGNLRSDARWVSKTSKKRYAYPTEKEALNYFIKKSERQISILKRQIWSCEISLREAVIKFKNL